MTEKQGKAGKTLPLCVDLDGTLVLTDTMWEAFFGALKNHPFLAFQMLWWIKRGRGYGKHEIARRASLAIHLLPYNKECIAWLKTEKQSGRKIYLVTGSNEKFATLIADQFGLFDGVISSTHAHIMSGYDKAAALVGRFGEGEFAYAGNAPVDIHVWKKAGEIIVVNASKSVITAAEKLGPITKIGQRVISWKVVLRALRWHQWTKNILIFVPLLTAHQLLDLNASLSALLAFVSFSAIASAVYLMNDLVDLPADRQNPYKKHRPLASGTLPILTALQLGLGLGIISIGIATLLPPLFLALIVGYAAINIAYSLRLKRVIAVDVLIIASLYVLRILAGSAATGVVTSPWLFAFAALVFLSLALVKRVSEINNLAANGKVRTAGRGYTSHHLAPLTAAGMICSALSLAVFSLYIGSPTVQTLYRTPTLLWLLLPLFAIWLARVWKITRAGDMHEDPTAFAAKDLISYTTALTAVVIVLLAT